MYDKMVQLYTYPFFFRVFTHMGITEFWGEVPVLSNNWSLLIIYFIYNGVHMLIQTPNLFPPPRPFPFGNCKFVFKVSESEQYFHI